MYKSGNDKEFFSELFIYKLGSYLDFDMAHYELDEGYIRTKDLANDYLKLIYFDTICSNIHRHTKNYGILRNPETGEIVKLAPNYDNNIALISRGYPRFIERNKDTLIDLFIELLESNNKALRLFKDINVPVITDELVRKCITETPFDVDADKISQFILNGQKRILDFLDNN